ncbi:MAG TPA: MFS transporter [Roseiflexaceae bacterium]|nr:MFS transporter [Roseiflexaceae bacterium]
MATLPQTEPPQPAAQRILAGFQALRERNYRLYWLGQLVSMTGSWMQTTAQAWLVLQLTNSAFAIGLVATLQFLPVLLLSLVGGVIADRVPRFRLILVMQILAMLLTAIFAALVGSDLIQLWHVYLLAALQGLVNAIDQPVRQAFAIELVDRERRTNAVALNSIMFNLARIVGPALAGILIAPFGIALVLWLNAASFLAVIGGLLLMDSTRFPAISRPHGRALADLKEGLVYAWRTPEVLLLLILVAAIGTFGYNFSVTLPLIGGFLLNTSAAEYGILGAVLGAGSLVGALFTAYARHPGLGRVLVSAVAFSLLLGAVALSSNYWLSLGLLLILGFAGLIFTTTAGTLVQLRVPDALRGRVTSLYMLLFMGSTPIGGLLVGTTAAAWGVSSALLICAACCLLGIGGGFLYLQRHPDQTGS